MAGEPPLLSQPRDEVNLALHFFVVFTIFIFAIIVFMIIVFTIIVFRPKILFFNEKTTMDIASTTASWPFGSGGETDKKTMG